MKETAVRPDAKEEAPKTGSVFSPSLPKSTGRSSRSRGRRRLRATVSTGARYFVGRPGEPDAKPTLEQEVASEPEALVIAFKSDKRVYFITEYRVTQKIEGGQVRLEKEPAASAAGHANVPKGVSTTNES